MAIQSSLLSAFVVQLCIRRSRAASQLVLATAFFAMFVSAAHAAAPANPLPGINDKWHHFKSPNFELYSRNADGPSRDLLYNLELLRAVFLQHMKLKERRQMDVTVFYFRSKREFQAYAAPVFSDQSSLAGFYLPRPDRAIISMAPADDSDSAQRTIFHEYVHHLFRVAEYNPPMWYNEGTAEVLAGIQFDGKRVQIGLPLENSAAYLSLEKLLPLDQLFAADPTSKIYTEEKHTGVFYAQSWALLHFWHFGKSGFSKDAIDRFLKVAGDRDLAAGTDLRKHFQDCFGCDYPEMLRRLKDYVRSGSYRYGVQPMPEFAPASSYVARAVPIDEISVRLAELAVRVNRTPAGKLVLLNAMQDRPNDPRSFETLGAEAFLEGDVRTATERWEQALTAGSNNPAVIRELALIEGQQWFSEFNESFRLPLDATTRMRTRLLRSIELEPAQAAAYEMLAWVEAFAQQPQAENINRVIAHLPDMLDKKRTLIALATIMLRVEKPEAAATMLDHVNTQRLVGADAHAISILRERLASDYPAIAASAAKSQREVAVETPLSGPGLKTPSVAVPDDL
jgi:hypothetical protein